MRRIEHAADRAVTALYHRHYRALVRLAALLVWDLPVAEEIVQDSFVALHRARPRLGDSDRAVSYLYRSVVHRSRLATRHRVTAPEHAPMPPPGGPATHQDTGRQDAGRQDVGQLDPAALSVALRALPGHHREALVLRYYADLPESQIGAALGISTAAVSRCLAQAVSSLQAALPTTVDPCSPSRKDPAGGVPRITASHIYKEHPFRCRER